MAKNQQPKVAVSFLADKIYLVSKYEDLGSNIFMAKSKLDITDGVLENIDAIVKLHKQLKEKQERKPQ